MDYDFRERDDSYYADDNDNLYYDMEEKYEDWDSPETDDMDPAAEEYFAQELEYERRDLDFDGWYDGAEEDDTYIIHDAAY